LRCLEIAEDALHDAFRAALVLEARDLNHAIQLISNHPGIKVGTFEIRPADDLSAMVAERSPIPGIS
jgi:hypothetical protein